MLVMFPNKTSESTKQSLEEVPACSPLCWVQCNPFDPLDRNLPHCLPSSKDHTILQKDP